MKIIKKYFILALFFIHMFQTTLALSNKVFFDAIKEADYATVQKMIIEGIPINTIDPVTKNTPIFYALSLLVHTLLIDAQLPSNIFGVLHKECKAVLMGGCMILFPPFCGEFFVKAIKKYQLLTTKTPDQDFFLSFTGLIFGLLIEILVVKSIDIKKNNKIDSYKKIIEELLKHPDLDLTYCHEKTGRTIKQYMIDIMNPNAVGYYYVYINNMKNHFPEDVAVCIIINNKKYVYPQRFHTKYLLPIFEQFLSIV